MGRERTTQTMQPISTPEEQELGKLELERARATQPGMIETQKRGLDLVSQLLAGGDLPGYLRGLPGGLSEEMIGEMAQEAIGDLPSMFQEQGILDSGVAPEIMARTAGDIRRGAAEFNIGNLLNLLNLAVGGQAQVQTPILAQQQLLSQRLAGLRAIKGTTSQANPFLRSWATSGGQTMGSPSFSVGPLSFGGGR